MRKLGLQYSLTANLYQQGLSLQEALRQGASADKWEQLQDKYGGNNIPEADWLGEHHCEAKLLAHTKSGYAF